MALAILDNTDTQEELEGDATVATETTLDPLAGNSGNDAREIIENQAAPKDILDLAENIGVGGQAEAGEENQAEPTTAMPMPTATAIDFDDEFVGVSMTQEVAASPESGDDATPMFSESAGDEWPAGEGPSPLEGVSVPDPKIGEVELATPASTAATLVAHFGKIHALETQIAESCELELELRERMKSLRKNRESMVERLTKLKNGVDDDDDGDDDSRDDSNEDHDLGGEASAAVPCPPQAWGGDPVETLESFGLKLAKVEALRAAADAGHFNGTLKGLRDWIAKADLWHRNVKGCGPSGAEKIGDALTAYMAYHLVADEPMTAEDEKRSEAAAIALGHTKPIDELGPECPRPDDPNCDCEACKAVMRLEAITIAVVPEALIEPAPVVESANKAAATTAEATQEAEPSSPPQAKPKRTRKPKSAKEKPEQPASGFHSANAGQLNRVSAIMSGELDLPDIITTEEQARLAGEIAGKSDQSCSANPFPRDHQFGKAWQAGWEATAVGAV